MVRTAEDRRIASFTSRWGAVTAALCLTHVLLALIIPDGPLHMGAATAPIEWGLLSQEFLALGLLAILPALPGSWHTRLFFSFIVTLVLVGGWITFLATDRFPGADGLRFLITVPEQSFEHLLQLQPVLLWSMPLVIAAGTVALTWLALHAGKASQTREAKVLVLLSAAIMGGSLIWHGVTKVTLATDDDDELYDLRTGVSYRADLFWAAAREDRAGPASALLRSTLVAWRGLHPRPTSDPRIPVDHPARRPGRVIAHGAPAHRWNVLLIEVESMRGDALRAWGSSRVAMPTVEAIAADGRRYLDTYTTATQTNLAAPVPLSGQYPLRTAGPEPYPVRAEYPKLLIYDLLAPQGWRAAVYSSQNESWWGMVNFLRSPSLDTLFNAENYRGRTLFPYQDLAFADFVTRARRSGKIDDHDTALEAVRWLAGDHHTPFFLYVNFQTTHIPYTTPAGAPHPFGPGPSFPVMFGRYPAESAEVVHNQYRNALAYVDQQIALLRQELVDDGRWDSTIVVVTGDHGQAFFEHGVAAHANGLWQEQIRVPLVVKAPDLAPGDDMEPASHIDVAPTIAALLGFPAQDAWQGTSLVGDSLPADRPRFVMVQSPLADESGVIAGRWKLVRNTLLGSVRLTDLVADHGEHRDASAAHPREAERLTALVNTWRAAQLDYYESEVNPEVAFPPRVGLPAGWSIASH